MHQILQYQIAMNPEKCNKSCKKNPPQHTTNPAKCNCNKSCDFPSQQNSGAVWGGVFWQGAAQIFAFHPAAAPAVSPERLHPLKSEAKLRQSIGQAAARFAPPRCKRPRAMGQGAQILTLEEGGTDPSPGWRGKTPPGASGRGRDDGMARGFGCVK